MKKPVTPKEFERGKRVRILRNSLGMTQAALGKSLGVDRVAVTEWEAGGGISEDNLAQLIEMGRTTRDWIQDGKGVPPGSKAVAGNGHDEEDGNSAQELREMGAPVRLIPVRGTVAAGLWFEHDDLSDGTFDPVPIIPTRFSTAEQFAFKVSGPSMDLRRIFSGDYIVCVPYWVVRARPKSGDIVVVERREGQRTERTCKEVQVVPSGIELWPRSSDKRFQEAIAIRQDKDSRATGGMQIEIIGLVIGVYSPR